MHHPDYHAIGHTFRHTSCWTDAVPLSFSDERVCLFNLSFQSQRDGFLLGHERYVCEEHGEEFPAEPTVHSPADCRVEQNSTFRYPLVREGAGSHRHRQAVIILHGLNERSFTKYIPWAYQLWRSLGVPVILFPLTFHINRVSPQWARDQQANYHARMAIPGNENVHPFNAVISDRLGAHPERFFWGAVQSYWDLVDLIQTIRSGGHLHLREDAAIDFLGFSAGGYVALALMLEHGKRLLRSSKAVVFASGAAVRDVNLSSHLIVDQSAEIALMNLYVKHRLKLSGGRLRHWMEQHAEGEWFNSFCGLLPDRRRLEQRLSELAPQLLAIANTNDQVFPVGALHNALRGVHRTIPIRIEELELGIHENPFACPDYDQRDRAMITHFLDLPAYGRAFERFIDLMAGHLARG